MSKKMSGLEELAMKLLDNVYVSKSLKEVSMILEELSIDKAFKKQAKTIACDERLSKNLKKTQMMYLFKNIDNPLVYDFFSDMFSAGNYMLFNSRQFDYFDEFVKKFQMKTEELLIVNLITAIEIKDKDLAEIAIDLGQDLETKIVIHPQVNASLMGGAQIRIGNMVFDFSLRSKFHQFQRQWLASMKKTSRMVGRV